MKIKLKVRQPGDQDWSTLNEVTDPVNPEEQKRARAGMEVHQQHWQQAYAPFVDAQFKIVRE